MFQSERLMGCTRWLRVDGRSPAAPNSVSGPNPRLEAHQCRKGSKRSAVARGHALTPIAGTPGVAPHLLLPGFRGDITLISFCQNRRARRHIHTIVSTPANGVALGSRREKIQLRTATNRNRAPS